MWKRATGWMRCPLCGGALDLHAWREERAVLAPEYLATADERGIPRDELDRYVDAGLLACGGCSTYFPVTHGLPVLLPYTTPIHEEFASEFRSQLDGVPGSFPKLDPVPGEQFVMQSFSREWLDYSYDGVIWDLSYEDHERRFLAEIGPEALRTGTGGVFLEIGCGIGLTTHFASKNLRCDAIGVDLSLAVLPATRHFRSNPFLHFMEASAFRLPLRRDLADVMYSHGVLHHTYSTRDAVRAVAPHCRPGGWLYLWLYGTESQRGSPLRRLAFRMESSLRPRIARNLASRWSRGALATFAAGYLLVNRYHRFRDASVAKYDFGQALHAARDRFTPLFAHRQDYAEVADWLSELGFEKIQQVDWRVMPSANQDNYRRNTGVRGRRGAAAVAT